MEAGKRHGVPTFNDAAADVPPVTHLSDYNKMGFDLVSFSGGKGLRGPQCAGLLLGRKDLIDAALMNNNPNEDTIGRPLKAGKEEIVGMFAALERYLRVDHAAEWKDWEARLDVIDKMVAGVPGVHTAIVGTTKPERWQENAKLVEGGMLSEAEVASIRERWEEIAPSNWIGQT